MIIASSPASLASFTTSGASSSKAPHVAISPVEGSDGKLGVAVVQGEGVWTYNLRTLRPTTSFTVSPSTRFSTPAISYIVTPSAAATVKGKGKAKEDDIELDNDSSSASSETPLPEGPRRRTVVAVVAGKKSQLWLWDGDEGADHTIIELEHPTQSLHRLSSSSYTILAVHDSSHLTLLSALGKPVQVNTNLPSSTLLAARVIPGDDSSSGLITVDASGHVHSLRIQHPDGGAPSCQLTSNSTIPSGKLVRAEIKTDGTIIASDSTTIITYDTRTSQIVSTAAPLSPSSTLLSLPLAKPVIVHHAAQKTGAILLTTLLSSSPAVLSAVDLAAIAPEGIISAISILAQPSPSSFVLGVVVWHKGEGAAGRSALHTMELTIPSNGLGMNALLGSAGVTSKYFDLSSGSVDSSGQLTTRTPSPSSQLEALLTSKALSESDWSSISDLLSASSLPSTLLVRVLHASLSTPHYISTYRAILALPPPDASFRVELRRTFSASETCTLLQQLLSWVETHASSSETLTLGPSDESESSTVVPASTSTSVPNPTSTLPPLQTLLPHISAILDAHLPTLISHPPAHDLLTHLSSLLSPLLTLQNSLSQLRAPIDALLTLARREERRRAAERVKRESMVKRATANTAAGGSTYLGKTRQIERQRANRGVRADGGRVGEEAVKLGEGAGKWSVEDFQF